MSQCIYFRKSYIQERTQIIHQIASIFSFIFRNKEFEEAVNFFTRALKIDPCFPDAYIGRGNSYMEYGHEEATKQAQKDFLKALHVNPMYTKARICLGYNLQVMLYNNHESTFRTRKSIFGLLLVRCRYVLSLAMSILPFPY